MTTEDPFPASALPEAERSAAPSAPRRAWGREAVVGLGVLGAVTLLGAPLGVMWSALSPEVLVEMTSQGAVLVDPQPEEYIAADGVFTLLGLGVGILLAVGCWFGLRRWRGPMVLVGLTAGSLLGACVAWQLGRRIGLADYTELKTTAEVGWQFYRPPSMSSGSFVEVFGVPILPRGALAAQGLAAAFVYTMIAGWSRFTSLRPGEDHEPDPE